MAWQANVGAGSGRATTYHDFFNKLVAFLTSKTVATVVVNNAGAGYVTGDVVKLVHASGYLEAKFEVTAVAGAITALRILSGGAYAVRATSATVGAAGTNYAVNDILEIQGGTKREPGKFKVATLSGSGVATVTLFETGGSYSSTPANNASTTKIGPNAGTGSGATLVVTYGTIIGASANAVTTVTGAGAGATVDITLTDVGWSVDGRNNNSISFNSVTNEKEAVLVGDASGLTNKPYVGLATLTSTSGINTRYAIAMHGMIAHNPALALSAQPNILGDPGTWTAGAQPFMIFDENAAQEMDFWMGADDSHFRGVYNINSGAASTDSGQYLQFYAGFGDSFATEFQDPYPYFIGASARDVRIDPSGNGTNITSLAEAVAPSGLGTGLFFYRTETSTWLNVFNSQNLSVNQTVANAMAPMCQLLQPTSGAQPNPANFLADFGPLTFYTGIGSTGRASPTRRLVPVPGSTPKFFPIPLTVLSRPTTAVDDVLDTARLQLRHCFWVFNTSGAVATITNFSEDYLTIGSDRYRVFHNHVQTQLYNFIAMKETV